MSCAGPLCISLADEPAGFLPWSGAGDSWIAWHYPYARPVRVITIRTPPDAVVATQFELWYALSPITHVRVRFAESCCVHEYTVSSVNLEQGSLT